MFIFLSFCHKMFFLKNMHIQKVDPHTLELMCNFILFLERIPFLCVRKPPIFQFQKEIKLLDMNPCKFSNVEFFKYFIY